jgi:ectoine hydroxylase-related dioxygenase (phytanoyl-CoA dioxygenase family)
VKFGHKQTTHRPYLTCWCPLDDVNEENGSVYLLPHSRGGTKNWIADHARDEDSSDLVGYTGDDPGIAVEAPAGSIVAFTSYNFHRSGANTTPNMRRVYLPQYSAEPILRPDGDLWGQAVPFVKDGKNIYDHAADVKAREGAT